MIDAPIFPCHPETKAPLVAGGFKAASSDPAQLARWTELYPNCLWGVPTGAVSGFDALDIDPRNGGDKWLKGQKLPRTRVHKTRSGGVHLLFKHTPGLRNSAGLLASGVDVRADGGYIIWWPAHGFDAGGPEMTEWPANVLVSLLRGQPSAVDGGEVDLDRRMPPSAEAVCDLLDRMENPLEVDRDTYVRVMTAAKGCIDALGCGESDEVAIISAACQWAERWPAYTGDEYQKWLDDWSKRDAPLAGWQSLQRVAAELVPGYTEVLEAERLAEAQEEFTFEPLPPPLDPQSLLQALSVPAWLSLGIPPKTRFLGDMLASASRLFLIGATGLGKTQIAHGMGAGIASGNGFLHWACDRPAKVLVIDGEMSTRLIQERLGDAVRRHPTHIPEGNLTVFAMDRAEEITKRFPELGKSGPLNTPDGQKFVVQLITVIRPEVVIFDNLMSLVTGDQTTEIPWSETKALRDWLVSSGIAQVWLDHTGNDRSRQYGSSTKRWGVDAVGIMSDVDGGDSSPDRIQFRLSFSAPHGKARERSKANWLDFADHVVTMEGDTWRSERLGQAEREALDRKRPAEPGPAAVRWHDALQIVTTLLGKDANVEAWWLQGVHMGLAEAVSEQDTRTEREAKRVKFRKAKSDLVTAQWAVIEGENVRDGRPDLALGAL
jgi:hypothetical protein